MRRFSKETEASLMAGGWYLGRSVLTQTRLPSDFGLFDAAASVLDEFGGLHIGVAGPGIDNQKSVLQIDAMKGEFADERFSEFAVVIRSKLYPLGEIDGENFYLAIDEQGRVFLLMDDLWFAGNNFDEALELLLSGRKVYYVDESGKCEAS
jgi:hypothetical protein